MVFGYFYVKNCGWPAIPEPGAVSHMSVSWIGSPLGRKWAGAWMTHLPPALSRVLPMSHAWNVSPLANSYLSIKAEVMIKLKLWGASLNKHIQNFPSYNLPVWSPEPSPPSLDCSTENRYTAGRLGSVLFYIVFTKYRLWWEELARFRSKIIDQNFKI